MQGRTPCIHNNLTDAVKSQREIIPFYIQFSQRTLRSHANIFEKTTITTTKQAAGKIYAIISIPYWREKKVTKIFGTVTIFRVRQRKEEQNRKEQGTLKLLILK